jgi:muconolactone delta-isomerase
MQYLVTEALIIPGPLLPPDQLVRIMRQWVFPSMDALINLKSEGKIIGGGVPVGERALVLIFEAESNEELDTILQRLPLWGLAKWKIASDRNPPVTMMNLVEELLAPDDVPHIWWSCWARCRPSGTRANP